MYPMLWFGWTSRHNISKVDHGQDQTWELQWSPLNDASALPTELTRLIWHHNLWPLETLIGQIKVKLNKNAHNFFLFSKSLIFGFKWLLGLFGHYSRKRIFCCTVFFQEIFSFLASESPKITNMLISWKPYIYLRHKVTIYHLYKLIYDLSFGIMTFDLEWHWKVKSRSNLRKRLITYFFCIFSH